MRLLPRYDSARPIRPLPAVAVIILLAAAAASATETRVRSLGGDGDYFEDLANVPRWYGSLPSYANTAVLELGEFDAGAGEDAADQQSVRQGAGALFDLDAARRYGTLGLYLFRDSESADGAGARTLMYGKAWTHAQAALVVGSRVQRTTREVLEEVVLGLGARADLGQASYVDLAADWRGSSYENAVVTTGAAEGFAWDSFSLRARAFLAPRQGWALVPACAYRRNDRWQPGETWGEPWRQDAWEARYGLGVNIFPTGDLLGLLSCEYRQGEESHFASSLIGEYRTVGLVFDAFVTRLGLEARLRPWLTLRGGVISTGGFDAGKLDVYAGPPDDFDLTLGCALHLGDLDADFLFNDDAPFNLGSLVTNAGGDEASTFSSVSLAYRF